MNVKWNSPFFLSGSLVLLASIVLFLWQYNKKQEYISIKTNNIQVEARLVEKQSEKGSKDKQIYRLFFVYDWKGEEFGTNATVEESLYKNIKIGETMTILVHPTNRSAMDCKKCTEYEGVFGTAVIFFLGLFALGGIFSIYLSTTLD